MKLFNSPMGIVYFIVSVMGIQTCHSLLSHVGLRTKTYKTMASEMFLDQIQRISLMNILLKLSPLSIAINPRFLVTQDLVLYYRPATKEAKQESRREWKTKLVFIFYSPE